MDAPAHDRCRIELLGGLRVQVGDRTIIRFSSARTRALLGLLACHRSRIFPRDELAEIVWPEAEPDAGRLSLRVALSSLRRQLEPPGTPRGSVIAADRNAVWLNPEAILTDVQEFAAALKAAGGAPPEGRIAALTRAVDLYGGELLPGLYDEWVLTEREELAQRYLAALRQLAGALRQTGDVEQALLYGRRAVRAEPFSEEVHAELIRLYLAAGRPTEARRHYQELERTLWEELGGAAGSGGSGPDREPAK